MKKHMKSFAGDIMSFSAGSMMAGAGGMMTAPFGQSGGISAASSMLPVAGTMVGLKPVLGMTGDLMKQFKTKRKRK